MKQKAETPRCGGVMTALVFYICAHVAALVSFLTALAPGIDLNAPTLGRAKYLADNPWLWRLGWFPWQLAAFSAVGFAIALDQYLSTRPRRLGRRWALLGVGCVLLAVVPDMLGQGLMETQLVTAAQSARNGAQLAVVQFVQLESWTVLLTGGYANGLYALMLFCWVVAIARAGGGLWARKGFVLVGVIDCALFAASSSMVGFACALASVDLGYPGYDVLYRVNAVAFPLLLVWLCWASGVLREIRGTSPEP